MVSSHFTYFFVEREVGDREVKEDPTGFVSGYNIIKIGVLNSKIKYTYLTNLACQIEDCMLKNENRQTSIILLRM